MDLIDYEKAENDVNDVREFYTRIVVPNKFAYLVEDDAMTGGNHERSEPST